MTKPMKTLLASFAMLGASAIATAGNVDVRNLSSFPESDLTRAKTNLTRLLSPSLQQQMAQRNVILVAMGQKIVLPDGRKGCLGIIGATSASEPSVNPRLPSYVQSGLIREERKGEWTRKEAECGSSAMERAAENVLSDTATNPNKLLAKIDMTVSESNQAPVFPTLFTSTRLTQANETLTNQLQNLGFYSNFDKTQVTPSVYDFGRRFVGFVYVCVSFAQVSAPPPGDRTPRISNKLYFGVATSDANVDVNHDQCSRDSAKNAISAMASTNKAGVMSGFDRTR